MGIVAPRLCARAVLALLCASLDVFGSPRGLDGSVTTGVVSGGSLRTVAGLELLQVSVPMPRRCASCRARTGDSATRGGPSDADGAKMAFAVRSGATMNVTFHTLTGLATAAMLSSRRIDPPKGVAVGSAVGVLTHAVLDLAPHAYPLRSPVDVVLSLALVCAALLLARPRNRALVVACFVGAELPDLIDLGPAQLNRRLGVSLPVVKLFPWHWPQYSGSVYDGSHAAASLALHVVVLALTLGTLYAFRASLFGGRESTDS